MHESVGVAAYLCVYAASQYLLGTSAKTGGVASSINVTWGGGAVGGYSPPCFLCQCMPLLSSTRAHYLHNAV